MIALDTILVIAEISAFMLLIGLFIYAIYDFNEERKSNEIEDYPSLIEDYPSLINEEDTNNTIIMNNE